MAYACFTGIGKRFGSSQEALTACHYAHHDQAHREKHTS